MIACQRSVNIPRVDARFHLDWAIGLAVVFFLGGALVSGLNEGLNWVTRVRAKFLWAYLYDHDKAAALPRGRLGILRLWGTSPARKVPGLRRIGWIAKLDTRDMAAPAASIE